MKSSQSRSASAPYFSTIASGVTTLPLLLDIFWPSPAQIIPWLRSTGNGSMKLISPASNITLVHIRAYSRCITACSAPPT